MPIPIPEIGSGYYIEEKYNIFCIATVCLFIVCGLKVWCGISCKQKSQCLIDHEPDSLL